MCVCVCCNVESALRKSILGNPLEFLIRKKDSRINEVEAVEAKRANASEATGNAWAKRKSNSRSACGMYHVACGIRHGSVAPSDICYTLQARSPLAARVND